MPEYPDVTVYVERICHFLKDRRLQAVRIKNPFLLRTAEPPIQSIEGSYLRDVDRLGKRIIFAFDDDLFLILHLMIAGRLQWRKRGTKIPGRFGLAALDFTNGSLLITEASSKKRASLHLVEGVRQMEAFDPGGVELFSAPLAAFARALQGENHTLKRSLTDPRLISGVGNAYSDEILHRAKMSPFLLTSTMSDAQIERLFVAAKSVLLEWTQRLRDEVGDEFPKRVTAFHEEMAVHGKYGQPCPNCGAPVQRIRYATRETNYCAQCQTGGKLLADRSLSRLLKKDWPRTLEALEQVRRPD